MSDLRLDVDGSESGWLEVLSAEGVGCAVCLALERVLYGCEASFLIKIFASSVQLAMPSWVSFSFNSCSFRSVCSNSSFSSGVSGMSC